MRLFGILTLSFLFALPSTAQDALTADAILKRWTKTWCQKNEPPP